MVNESFQDPVLIRLYDQIRNLKKKFQISSMFGTQVRLDRILPSQRTTYKYDDEAKMLKAARKILANTNRDLGFIATEDWDGNFVMFFNNNQAVFWLKEGGFPSSWRGDDYEEIGNVNSLLDMLKRTSPRMTDIKYVHIWSLTSDRWQIQSTRRTARDGMIDVRDADQMHRMLRDQQDKYRRAVKAIKAARGTDQYKTILSKVDSIMQRFSKFMNKMIMDPSWASTISWRADEVFKSIRQGYERGSSYQHYGVIYTFQNWSQSIVRTLAQETTYGKIDDSELLKAIDWANKSLLDVGL